MASYKVSNLKLAKYISADFFKGLMLGIVLVVLGFFIYLNFFPPTQNPPTNMNCSMMGCHMIRGRCLCGY